MTDPSETPTNTPGLPRLALGTMTFGKQTDADSARTIVDSAIDSGVSFIDTANVYVRGRSEEILGASLGGRRDQVILASKVGSPRGRPGTRLDSDTMRQELEGSLQRLRTDYLDLYYLHRPDRQVPLEETLGALAEMMDEGLIRSIGTSNYPAWQLAQMHAIAGREGWQPARVAQPMYNLLARRIEDEYVEATTSLGIANAVYNPLAGGLLTGKHRAGEEPAADSRFAHDQFRDQYRDRYWNEAQFTAVDALRQIADEAGIRMTELAFRWLLSQPHVDSIILGVSRLEQLTENLDLCGRGPLPDDVLAACDTVRHLAHGIAPVHVK